MKIAVTPIVIILAALGCGGDRTLGGPDGGWTRSDGRVDAEGLSDAADAATSDGDEPTEAGVDAGADGDEPAEAGADGAADGGRDADRDAADGSWARRFGGEGYDAVNALLVGEGGELYVAGQFRWGSLELGGESFGPVPSSTSSVFVARLEPDGEVSWAMEIDHAFLHDTFRTSDDRFLAFAPSGDLWVAGTYWMDSTVVNAEGLPDDGLTHVFLARLSPEGELLGVSRFSENAAATLHSIVVDDEGSVFLTGEYWGAADLGGGALPSFGFGNAFVLKVDDAGEHLWSTGMGGSGFDVGVALALTAAGRVVVAGELDSVDFQAGDEVLSNGSDNPGDSDVFVAALDASGDVLWARSYGGDGVDEVAAMVAGEGERVYVAGRFASSTLDLGEQTVDGGGYYDAFVAAVDESGVTAWAHAFGAENYESCNALGFSAGVLYLAGGFSSERVSFGGGHLEPASPHQLDVFVAGLDATGGHVLSRSYGGTGSDYATALVVGPEPWLHLVGNFESEDLDLGSGTFAFDGAEDFFVARLLL